MVPFVHLWLPIVLSGASVWIASAVIWMAMPHHKHDHIKLPDEGAFMGFLRSQGIGPGNYGFPHCHDRGQMKDPEFQKRWKEGPIGFITVMPGGVSMARNMVLTFLVYVVVSVFIAYVGSATLGPGTGFAKVFQVLGTVGVLAYSFAFIPSGIWFGQYPRAILASVIDGVAYGLITGAIFAATWPAA